MLGTQGKSGYARRDRPAVGSPRGLIERIRSATGLGHETEGGPADGEDGHEGGGQDQGRGEAQGETSQQRGHADGNERESLAAIGPEGGGGGAVITLGGGSGRELMAGSELRIFGVAQFDLVPIDIDGLGADLGEDRAGGSEIAAEDDDLGRAGCLGSETGKGAAQYAGLDAPRAESRGDGLGLKLGVHAGELDDVGGGWRHR